MVETISKNFLMPEGGSDFATFDISGIFLQLPHPNQIPKSGKRIFPAPLNWTGLG
jgi:hypothetical protein